MIYFAGNKESVYGNVSFMPGACRRFVPFGGCAGRCDKYEAEDQTLASGATVKRDSAGVSGGKYVNANGFTFKVTVDSSGMYDPPSLMWVKQYDWFNSSIYINGGTTAIATFLTNSQTSAFTAYTLTATAKLLAGENSITVKRRSSNFDLSYGQRAIPAVFTSKCRRSPRTQ